MSEVLQADDFKPYVGKVFRVVGTRFVLSLVQIESKDHPLPSGATRRPFLLIFSAPNAGGVLPEGLYDCEIEGGPKASLYITPIHTPPGDRQHYQAPFS
jgi:hypothetical protein